jgi:hypothetical protein
MSIKASTTELDRTSEKFAAKLCTNDFTSPYTTLLDKLKWKPISQIVMERRATTMHTYVYHRKQLPEGSITLSREANRRRTGRNGHDLKLVLPSSTLTAIQSSLLSIAKKTWNALPAELVSANSRIFNQAVRNPVIYETCLGFFM